MNNNQKAIKLLLVDDEAEFRQATGKILGRRGFTISEAESGAKALEVIRADKPDIVILDLKMPGLSGIETLEKIREFEPKLPVLILTGHGSFDDALAGIELEIADFLQKPIDIDLLEARIRMFIEHGRREPLKEHTLPELMVSPSLYPKLYIDQPAREALETLRKAFFPHGTGVIQPLQIRSALVYDRNENFVGVLRFIDLLRIVLPEFLADNPYVSFFTGMFLAQSKLIGERRIEDLMGENITIPVNAPLIQAVHLMLKHRFINLPVMKGNKLVGILREKDIILDIANNLGTIDKFEPGH
jgi:CheY-like chemotaxis protein